MPDSLPYDEKELLLKIAEGDEKAFADFFRKWATALAAIAMKIVQDEFVKQEVVQEIFIKVWLNRDKLCEVENLGAWLRTLITHQSIQALQKRAAYDKRLAALRLVKASSDNSNFHLSDFKETQQIIQSVINSLPPQRKSIFYLNRIEGKTTREISELLNLSHGYVRNALSAALSTIRTHLKKDLGLSIFLASLPVINIF